MGNIPVTANVSVPPLDLTGLDAERFAAAVDALIASARLESQEGGRPDGWCTDWREHMRSASHTITYTTGKLACTPSKLETLPAIPASYLNAAGREWYLKQASAAYDAEVVAIIGRLRSLLDTQRGYLSVERLSLILRRAGWPALQLRPAQAEMIMRGAAFYAAWPEFTQTTSRVRTLINDAIAQHWPAILETAGMSQAVADPPEVRDIYHLPEKVLTPSVAPVAVRGPSTGIVP